MCRYQVSFRSDVPAAPALFGCISNGFCHGFCNLLVKDVGKDTIALRPGYILCYCVRCGNFHLVSNPCRAGIERPAEYSREREHVIDLVGEIAPAGPDNARPLPALLRPARSPEPGLPSQRQWGPCSSTGSSPRSPPPGQKHQ